MAYKNRIEGRVIVGFIIERDGTISNVKILKGIGNGCDEEVERVIALTSGKWTLAMNHGEVVRYKTFLPVFFKLPLRKK